LRATGLVSRRPFRREAPDARGGTRRNNRILADKAGMRLSFFERNGQKTNDKSFMS